MVKKALIVGLNYPNQKHQLYGCVNDSLNWNALLGKEFGFEEIRVLIDQSPDGSVTTAPTQIPSKQNILSQLGWLCSGVQQGDTLAFVFAGHGCQVLQGGEFADEALVPEDYSSVDEHGNPTLVFDDELHALFKRLPSGSFLTTIFDCSHAAHMLDVPCCVEGGQELRTRSRPLQVHKRFEPAWRKNEHAFARPRFIAPVQWKGPRQRRIEEGTGQHVGRMNLDPGVTAISFAACSTHEVALDANIKAQQQGLMSFCLLAALAAKRECTYETLLERASEIAEDIRSKYMPTMDQHIHMSFCPYSPPREVVVLDERYATVSQHRLGQKQQQQQQQQQQRPCSPQQQQRPPYYSATHSPENRRHDMQQQRAAQEQRPHPAAPRQVSSDFVPAPQYCPPQSATTSREPSPQGRRPTTQEMHSPMPHNRALQEAPSPMTAPGAGAGIDLRAYGMGPLSLGQPGNTSMMNLGAPPAVGSYTQAPPSGMGTLSPMPDPGTGGSPMPERNIFGIPNLFNGIGDINGAPSSNVGSTGVPSMLGNLFGGSNLQVQQPATTGAFSSQQQQVFPTQQQSSTTNAFASGGFGSHQAFGSQQQAGYGGSLPTARLQPGPARTGTTTPHVNAYNSGTSSAFGSGAAGGGAVAAYQQMRFF
jgi:hypothetical protein